MHRGGWVRRVGWLAAVTTALACAAPARAQDGEDFGPVVGRPDPLGPDARPDRVTHGEQDHVPGTDVAIQLRTGDVLTVGTCGVGGGIAAGDTTLALIDPRQTQIETNDDACGGLGSRIVHRAIRDGTYTVRLGCYRGQNCGGRLAWVIGDEEAEAPTATFSAALEARGLVGPEGQAALVDAWMHTRFDAMGGLVLRLSGSPMGIGGGVRDGIFGGAIQLVAGFDLGYIEIAIGGGVATLSQRPAEVAQAETGSFALRGRVGLTTDFHVSVDAAIAVFGDEQADGTVDGRVVLPVGEVELVARALYGFSGVWMGELGAVLWLEGESRRGVGISVMAGGGALFYQPICRFGLPCAAVTYAGPHLGLGIHVRP